MVPPHTRRAGRYLLGPRLGVSPVKSIVQCLARLENTDRYFQVKLLTIFSGMGRNPREESQDEKQGKVHYFLSFNQKFELFLISRKKNFFSKF